MELSHFWGANNKTKYHPINVEQSRKQAMALYAAKLPSVCVLVGPRCHCLLSSWGSFFSLCPVVLMYFFICGVCHNESALPSTTHPSILLSARSALGKLGILLEDRKHLLTPHLMHIFLRAMEELRGKA